MKALLQSIGIVLALALPCWAQGFNGGSGGGGGGGANLAAPGPIGGTTPNTGQFTTLGIGGPPSATANSIAIAIGVGGPFMFWTAGANWAIGLNNTAFLYGPNDGSSMYTGNSTSFSIHGDNAVASMARMPLFFDEGTETALVANESMGTFKTVKAITIENITLDIKKSPACTVSEQITCYDCGAAAGACTAGQTATIMSAVTIASAATRQSINETIATPNVAAGEYISCLITAGTCTVSDNSISMMTRPQ